MLWEGMLSSTLLRFSFQHPVFGHSSVKCASNYTGEELLARYQRCGKDRCGGPVCTATEPVFATGGTGNNMPPEDVFQVWVVVCHKRTKECYKFFPSRPRPFRVRVMMNPVLHPVNFTCTLSAFE